MGKFRRGALWALFPPAGAVASVRAGQRKDTQKIVDAINGKQKPTVGKTSGGFKVITGADGRRTVLLSKESLAFSQRWDNLGRLTEGFLGLPPVRMKDGLMFDEIVEALGGPDNAEPKPAIYAGKRYADIYTWSRPGVAITATFSNGVVIGQPTKTLG